MHLMAWKVETDSVYLDYAKAFDRVDHNILIRKLRSYKVHDGLVTWIQSFLEGKVQRVTVDGCQSEPGSVLGPMLFLIHISE